MIKQRFLAILATALLGLFLSGAASAYAYRFGTYATYGDALPSHAGAVVVGDVTGDGRDDMVLATGFYFEPTKDYNLFIYSQTAQGTFNAPVQLPYQGTADYQQVRMQLADLNNDGIKDIIVGHDQGVTLFIARGGARFSASKIELPGALASLAVADLDQDGDMDIVRQAYDDSALAILVGNGKGAFNLTSGPVAHAAWHQAFKIGDVTGDRLLDLVFSNQLFLTVYPGNGTGKFAAPREYAAQHVRGYASLAIADVNRDGRNDVLATESGNPPNALIWNYLQAADGSLMQTQPMETDDCPEALTFSDLDHNGYQDMMVMHAGWAMIGVYFQQSWGFEPEAHGSIPESASHYNQDGLSTGDFNGDGCTDVAIATYPDGIQAFTGSKCYEPWAMANRHDGDFDGDGTADILWHNTATGASVIWKSGNSAAQIAMTRVTNTGWTIAGVGDFNGDGKSDVLWHHVVTGANTLWHSGDSQQSSRLTRITNLSWEIVGIGDFDGNGRDDILWRHKYSGANSIWEGGYYSNARNLASLGDMDWKVVGVGDFDGNGQDDIFWRDITDGRNMLWRNANSQDNQVTSSMDLGWQAAGLGDFDNDGRADILWHHAFDGRNAIWYSASDITSRLLTQVTNLYWKIAGIGDYTHDGHPDILWRNSRTGANIIWRDATSTAVQRVTGVTNMNWKVMR